MTLPQNQIYLNTAAFGLIDPTVKAAGDALYTDLATYGSSIAEGWRAEYEPKIHQAIAAFIGADENNVATIPNFSWALNGLVQSLGGDEKVLLYRGDYPSLLEPFRMNGFDIRWIESHDDFALPLDKIEEAIRSGEVDIVALSHVQYNSGYKLPVAQVSSWCREHGVRFILDATQSLGAIPTNVTDLGIDVLISSNYKWMNAGFGTGILYMSDDFMAEYPPVVGGNNSNGATMENWLADNPIRGYEPGHPNVYGLTILEAAIRQRMQQDVVAIETDNNRLTKQLLDGIKGLNLPLLGPYNMENRCSILLLRDEDGLSEWIKKHGITVTNRGGLVRVSMHHYNTEEDVEVMIACLQKFRN